MDTIYKLASLSTPNLEAVLEKQLPSLDWIPMLWNISPETAKTSA